MDTLGAAMQQQTSQCRRFPRLPHNESEFQEWAVIPGQPVIFSNGGDIFGPQVKQWGSVDYMTTHFGDISTRVSAFPTDADNAVFDFKRKRAFGNRPFLNQADKVGPSV